MRGSIRDDDGLLRLSVGTHGYTNVGMAVSKLPGFDLCPRLRNLSERQPHLQKGVAALSFPIDRYREMLLDAAPWRRVAGS